MTIIELWWLSLAIFSVVVVVVAILLGLIIATAKSIDRHAGNIWTAGKQIAGNTVSIWMLEETNNRLKELVHSMESLEETAVAIDDTVAGVAGDGRRRA
jgi:hypothetical protein